MDKNIIEYIIQNSYDKIKGKCSRFESFTPETYKLETVDFPDSEFETFEKGELEIQQEKLQRKELDKYTNREKAMVQEWSVGVIGRYLARLLYYGEKSEYLPSSYYYDDDGVMKELSVQQQADAIHNAILKSPRLQQDTVLYRGGRWVSGLKAGDKGEFSSFSSTSYQESIAKGFGGGDRYKIKIYAPKGTKGVLVNDDFDNEYHQHEWLLDKGQKYVVLSQNDETHEVEILLLKK